MRTLFASSLAGELELIVNDDVDLDGSFDAVCADTGERLRINGWNWVFEDVRGE